MARVDLITGMTAAGKSTFASLYLSYLRSRGLNPFYARANFGEYDMDGYPICFRPDGWKLEQQLNSPRRILAALPRAAKGYDYVVLECNRMLKRSEYQRLFAAPELIAYEPGAVIAVLRAQPYGGLRAEALRRLLGILESVGVVTFNNKDVTAQQVQIAHREISQIMRARLGSGIWDNTMENRILETPWRDLGEREFERMRTMSPVFFGDVLPKEYGPVADMVFFPEREFTCEELERRLAEIAGGSCGGVMRIKGRLNRAGGSLIVDWTESVRKVSESPLRETPGLVIVGFHMDHDRIGELLR